MMKLYIFCRKIHRFIAIAAAMLLIFMAGTGVLLKYPQAIDMGYVRYIHGAMALWAALAVVLMAGTGLVLYIFPLWQRRKQIT